MHGTIGRGHGAIANCGPLSRVVDLAARAVTKRYRLSAARPRYPHPGPSREP